MNKYEIMMYVHLKKFCKFSKYLTKSFCKNNLKCREGKQLSNFTCWESTGKYFNIILNIKATVNHHIRKKRF